MADDGSCWWLVPLAIGGLILGGLALSKTKEKVKEDLGVSDTDLEVVDTFLSTISYAKRRFLDSGGRG